MVKYRSADPYVRILPCFQEETMVQEDLIKVGEDDGLKQKKRNRSRYVS